MADATPDCSAWWSFANVDCATAAIKHGLHNAGTVGSNVVDKAIAGALGPYAAGAMQGWQQMEKSFLTSWLGMPEMVDPSNPASTVAWMIGLLSRFTMLIAIVGCLVTAIWTLITLRGDRAQQLGVSVVRMLIINGAGTTIFVLLEHGIRVASFWILDQAKVTASASLFEGMLSGAQPYLFFIIGTLGVIGVMIQWVVMGIRNVVLLVILAVWPLSSAFAMLGRKGAESFEKITAWLIALLIYPFATSIVYAFAFKEKTGTDGLGGAMNAMVLQVLATFALPALFRIIVPAAGALGKAYGGAIALKAAIQAAETAVTVGAIVVTAGAASAAAAGGAAAKKGAQAAATKPPTSSGGAGAGGAGGRPSGAASSAGGQGATTTGPASQPAPQQRPAGAGQNRQPDKKQKDEGQMARIYARQQAAQTLGTAAAGAARRSVEDLDDVIGGHQ